MLKKYFFAIYQRIYQIFNKKNPCQGKVYMFHDISTNNNLYSISEEAFEKFINWLVNNKKIVTIDALINDKNENNVILTFDDAYQSVYYKAFPILKKLDIPFYIFVNNELIDKQNYLTTEMIDDMLKNDNCYIGSHGLKHNYSREINDEEFNKCLLESKNELEELFKVNITEFAFPYGSIYACSKENIKIAKKHFRHIFMTYKLSYNEKYGNVIPRININNVNYYKEII